jgi:hypothetical protein
MIEKIRDVEKFVAQAPLIDIEKHIITLQNELSKKNRTQNSEPFQFAKSKFSGQYDR